MAREVHQRYFQLKEQYQESLQTIANLQKENEGYKRVITKIANANPKLVLQ
jgi:hypothetical protein